MDAEFDVVTQEMGVSASKEQLLATLRYHRLLLAIAGALLGLGLLLLLLASCALRRFISGPSYAAERSEMTTLLDDEESSDVI